MPRIARKLLAAASLLFAATTMAQPPAADGLNAVMDAQFQRAVAADPELASLIGAGTDDSNGRLTDISLAQREALRAQMRTFLAEIDAFDRDRLHGQERWSHDTGRWFYQRQLELLSFDWAPAWMQLSAGPYAVDHLFGMATMLPRTLDANHAVVDEAGARQYIRRLHAAGIKLDQLKANFDMQAAQGVVPPRVALEGAAQQIGELIRPPAAESVFVQSLARKLDKVEDLDPALRERLLSEATAAVEDDVDPAYAHLLARLEQAIASQPHSRGLWVLPQGDAYYAAALRWYTSTDMPPEEVHAVGLAEVARIEQAMDQRLREIGLAEGSLVERIEALNQDPRRRYEDSEAGREALLADVRTLLDRADAKFPTLFTRLPTQPLDVRRVPEYAQDGAPGAYYTQPAQDGSRPGIFFLNLGTMDLNWWTLPTLAYHEGAPGHHFQVSLSQGLTDLPILRRTLNPSAFSEGWALYAEQLMAEQGAYDDDPAGDLGRLQAEMFRAVRLVLDTGLHRMRWTPERAIAYLREKTGKSETESQAEVYRYLVQPGQASSYKIGQLKLLQLRARARDRLGEDFDLRAFHDVLLLNGALPLEVVEQVVDEWVQDAAAKR
ncbi:DUF885 domain-containing protein [Pseudoxanthomonas putridarboris]|uniref:DUF885 domain-containing protein n=1 Tax=Pseudoxanthomonas putridarboris TaxID=752605 RepID=A0ABU9IZ31_9GAMM